MSAHVPASVSLVFADAAALLMSLDIEPIFEKEVDYL